MFELQPINTSNLISFIQIAVVGIGFYFSWKGLVTAIENIRISTANAQVQLYNQLVLQGRDLEPIREVWIHDETFAASRLSMMRIMARRTKAATVVA
jgi:cob(I)alamin adenosyltransferase